MLRVFKGLSFISVLSLAATGAGAQVNWTAQNSGTPNTISSVVWMQFPASSAQEASKIQQLVAVGEGGSILTSPNGVTWTARTSGTTNTLSAVAWAKPSLADSSQADSASPQLVAVGYQGTILTSPEGVIWTAQNSGMANPLPFTSLTWTGSASDSKGQAGSIPGQWVTVGEGGTILTSANGTDWKAQNSGTKNDLMSVTWTGSQLVVVGSSSTILTSPDGVAWTAQKPGKLRLQLMSVTSMGSQLVAVGYPGIILTSPDGITWTFQNSGTKNGLYFVTSGESSTILSQTGSGNGQLMALGDAATILSSVDGVAWTPQGSRKGDKLYSGTWTGQSSGSTVRQFIAVGDAGIILTSPQDPVRIAR